VAPVVGTDWMTGRFAELGRTVHVPLPLAIDGNPFVVRNPPGMPPGRLA
jgi:hypothetical protein